MEDEAEVRGTKPALEVAQMNYIYVYEEKQRNGIETGYGGEASTALCLTGVYIEQRGGADTAPTQQGC